MPGDYSEELVELVARAIGQGRWSPPWEDRIDREMPHLRDVATVVLDALSSAGRLVPEGSEVREEWRVTGDPGHGFPPYDFTWSSARQDDPEGAARSFVDAIRSHDTWPDGPHLAQRTVFTTPWTPSEPAQEER